MSKCPVCDKELTEVYRHATAWGTEESQYRCPDSCYVETFAYGSTEINVCGFTTGYYHTTPREEINKIYKQVKAIAEFEKANGGERE